jgi:molecular chaperone HscB
MFCAGCGALQPPVPTEDHFEVLGVARRFDLNLEELERNYKERTRQVHPDRFARADARARRASLERSVQLNQAWKTLRDPTRRAEYLLHLAGIEVGGEAQRPSSSASSASSASSSQDGKECVPVPQELLVEILELREALLDARTSGDADQVRALTEAVRARRGDAMSVVASALSGNWPDLLDSAGSPGSPDLSQAADELVAIRYFDRFLEEVAEHEEALAERADLLRSAAANPEIPHG